MKKLTGFIAGHPNLAKLPVCLRWDLPNLFSVSITGSTLDTASLAPLCIPTLTHFRVPPSLVHLSHIMIGLVITRIVNLACHAAIDLQNKLKHNPIYTGTSSDWCFAISNRHVVASPILL